ncbi:MAG: hypothetical protein QXT05_02090 [Candidatus Bilamarchaeaceae archaeon]
MSAFNKEEFNKFIIEHNVVGFFKEPITLKSGRKSNWYVNWRTVTEDTYLTDKLTDFVISFVRASLIKPDCFYGVPEGATKIAVITQFKWAKAQIDYSIGRYPLPMGRGKPKEHGDPKDRYFLGMPKGKTVVIEDVTTTGGSLISAIKTLKDADVNVVAAISLTNRMEKRDDGKTVEEVVSSHYVKYLAMSDATELLPIAYSKLKPSPDVGKRVEEYFKLYGVKEVKLL